MVLGYYKSLFRKKLKNTVRLFNLRKKHHIGHNTEIANDTVFLGKAFIRDNVIIGPKVVLGKNVTVGNYSVLSNIEIGDDSQIELGVICTGYGNGRIKIGSNCYIGIYNVMDWSDNISIGDNVHIAGPSTGLWSHSSAKQCLNGLPLNDKREEFRPTSPVVVENNVYIGGNCTIYPGVTIESHSIIAPNSVVTKNVKRNSLVGGVPAKLIKTI